MESAREYEVTEPLNAGQLRMLNFIRNAGAKGVPWGEVRDKCRQIDLSADDFDSLTMLGLIKQDERMIITATEYL